MHFIHQAYISYTYVSIYILMAPFAIFLDYLLSGLMHFYHLHALDWVDVVSALKADPKATAKLAQSLSPWPRNSVQELTAVKDKLAELRFLERNIGPTGRLALKPLRRADARRYEVAANWKILCENYSECYHCPALHRWILQPTAQHQFAACFCS